MKQFSKLLLTTLVHAHDVVAFTGAGVSAESGVPTFRGDDGIWKKFRPEELASMDAFMRNPSLVWEWYDHRRKIISQVQPNAGHAALVALEHVIPNVTIITQNIDNLHRRAGSTRVLELHGNIERCYCMTCGRPGLEIVDLAKGETPRCPCGGILRPDVVWFGEMLPEDIWEEASSVTDQADVFLSIGTSSIVYPAASLPYQAKRAGAFLVEINPMETPLTETADEFLQGPSGAVLPELIAAIASFT